MPSSASAVGMYDAEISKLENKISREREQKMRANRVSY